MCVCAQVQVCGFLYSSKLKTSATLAWQPERRTGENERGARGVGHVDVTAIVFAI